MDEPLSLLPPDKPAAVEAPNAEPDAKQHARKGLLRGVASLLAATALTFTLTIWMLTRLDARHEAPAPIETEASAVSVAPPAAPEGVVREQLDAFRRGEVREAYNLFSAHYRNEVSFEAFHDLVASHWRMLRAKTVEFESREATSRRAVLDTHIISTDGERYLARYTLVESGGRWWIDDVHWGLEPDAPRETAALQI